MSTDAIDGVATEPVVEPVPAKASPKKKKPVKKAAAAPAKKTAAPAKAAPKTKKVSHGAITLKEAQLAAITLKMASDPTRLQVITILSDGECHVGGLSSQLNQSQPAVSHHLALLRHGGIIMPRRDGKNNFYSLTERGEVLARVIKPLMDD